MALKPLIMAVSLIGIYSTQATGLIWSSEQQILVNNAANVKSVAYVRDELRKAEVIPTVLDDFVPSATLSIAWPYKDTDSYNVTAELGNTISPSKLQHPPNIFLIDEPEEEAQGGKKHKKKSKKTLVYVVTLTDPDAPSRDDPKWSEMCHWILAIRDREKAKPYEVIEYKPPGPPKKTGKHRYVFAVWVAANRTASDLNLSTPKDRQHWGYDLDSDGEAGRVGVRKWATDMGLLPIAANFIYSQDDTQ